MLTEERKIEIMKEFIEKYNGKISLFELANTLCNSREEKDFLYSEILDTFK